MKRIFLFSLLFSVVGSVCAAGSYSSESSDGATFIAIITIAAAVLQIILFFKIWGMTNNVKALTLDHFSAKTFQSDDELARFIRQNYLAGNHEAVAAALQQHLFTQVERGYARELAKKKEKGLTEDESREEVMKMPIGHMVSKLEPLYDKIGATIPSRIRNLHTYDDYFIFTTENLE
ncbi:MAG: hypothetical protein IJT98_02735 [Prevotella sp.]|nr:hypothetical protein [Prevotella sp.]